jgi:putative aldouronate transport system permease protein
VYLFLSTTSSGLVNNIIERLGGERIIFMAQPRSFLPLLVITDVWKAMGFNSIIFIAAVASIEQQLYEAAMIDGATRWQRMRFITLPSIMPAVVIVAILTAGTIFNSNFEQIWTLLNPVIRTHTFVINVWAYYVGIASRKYSLGTAINLFQSLISFGLVMLANYISRKVRGSGLF